VLEGGVIETEFGSMEGSQAVPASPSGNNYCTNAISASTSRYGLHRKQFSFSRSVVTTETCVTVHIIANLYVVIRPRGRPAGNITVVYALPWKRNPLFPIGSLLQFHYSGPRLSCHNIEIPAPIGNHPPCIQKVFTLTEVSHLLSLLFQHLTHSN
jgi:hypothetical protein